jgi:hypothetical protein
MNAYELADKLEWHWDNDCRSPAISKSIDMLRQQADRIAELEKEVLMWENAEVPTEVMADTIQELERRGFITTPQIKELSDEEIERIYYKTLNRFDFARAILKKASEK